MLTVGVLPSHAWAQGKKAGPPVSKPAAPKAGSKPASKPASKPPAATPPPAAPPPAAAPPKPATPTTGVAIDKANWKQKQAATKAYKKGVAAMDRKAFDKALVAFRSSYGVVASPNSRLMVVRALAALERRPEAYEEVLAVVSEAKAAAAKSAKYKKTLEAAETELGELKKSLAFLTVNVTGALEGATLSIAGNPVPQQRWGKSIAVDPGSIEVVLSTADGKETKKVDAAAGATAQISISPPKPDTNLLPPPPPEPEVSAGYEGPDRRLMAYIAGGVGGVGILTFGIFGLLSNSKYNRLEAACPDMAACDPDLVDTANSGKTFQTVANVGLAFGLIGLAAGGGMFVWEVLDPAADEKSDEAAPKVSVGPGSVIVSGRF